MGIYDAIKQLESSLAIAEKLVGSYGTVSTPAGLSPTILQAISELTKDREYYATKAAMDADLVPADRVMAEVMADPVADNNRLYIKQGTSGTGAWLASSVDRIESVRNLFQSLSQYTGNLLDDAQFENDSTSVWTRINGMSIQGIVDVTTPIGMKALHAQLAPSNGVLVTADSYLNLATPFGPITDADTIHIGAFLSVSELPSRLGFYVHSGIGTPEYEIKNVTEGLRVGEFVWLSASFSIKTDATQLVFGLYGEADSAIDLHMTGFTFKTEKMGPLVGFEPNLYREIDRRIATGITSVAPQIDMLAKQMAWSHTEKINALLQAGEDGYPDNIFSTYFTNPTGSKGAAVVSPPADAPVSSDLLPQWLEYSWNDDQHEKKFDISSNIASGLSDLKVAFWLNMKQFNDLGGENVGIYDGAGWREFEVADLGSHTITPHPDNQNVTCLISAVDGNYAHIQLRWSEYGLFNGAVMVRFKGGQFESGLVGGAGTLQIGNVVVCKGTLPVHPYEVINKLSPGTTLSKAKAYTDAKIISDITAAVDAALAASVETLVDSRVATAVPVEVAGVMLPRVYGSKVQRFLKKARDHRSGRNISRPPKIVMIGDSITGGAWAEGFKSWLCGNFNIPLENFEIHWYGGYSIAPMLPFVDDVLVHGNPDLVLFGEFESSGPEDAYLHMVEHVIKLVRDRTTADIGIYTWSMSDTTAQAYIDGTPLTDNTNYQLFNWYRDIARVYNCELIDFNQALKIAIDNGATVASLGMSGPHLSTDAYNSVFLPEIKLHFGTSDNQENLHTPYPLEGKETLDYFISTMMEEGYPRNIALADEAQWYVFFRRWLRSETNAAIITVSLADAIGFELYHQGGYASLFIDDGGGYKAPSALAYRGKPLQYASEIVSTTYASNWDSWRMKRPFKKCVVTGNVLANGELISGQYTIVVTNVQLDGDSQMVTCDLKDPSGTVLSTFVVGQTAVTAGNLHFPLTYNTEENFLLSTADVDDWGVATNSNFIVGDEYEFFIHNNWVDTISEADTTESHVATTFGLERGDHTLKITVTDWLNLVAIKVLH